MSHLDWVNVAGYCASLLVFGAFYMTAMIPLRAIAIASNIAFIAYGFGHDLYPVLILHALLLPLNCFRLMQLRRSSRRVRGECGDDPSNEWLIPLMSTHTFKSGDVLFQLYCQDPTFGLYLIAAPSFSGCWWANAAGRRDTEYAPFNEAAALTPRGARRRAALPGRAPRTWPT
jgi:hypothetical protein